MRWEKGQLYWNHLKLQLDYFSCLTNCASFFLILQDKEIRERLQDSEYKLGFSMPLEDAKERVTQLQSELTLLER